MAQPKLGQKNGQTDPEKIERQFHIFDDFTAIDRAAFCKRNPGELGNFRYRIDGDSKAHEKAGMKRSGKDRLFAMRNSSS
jgi:hypothetical protein